jgi:xylulokinase
MRLVAGVDSSTQSCKVLIRDLATGQIVRQGSAKHPDGCEVDPNAWWSALQEAIATAGGLDGVEAISIAAQQHGMVALDADGNVIRKALLWNDTRSAGAAIDLIAEIGADKFVKLTGSVPVASFTITKLRWLRDNEPANAAKVAAVALPHDWLSWRLRGYGPTGESKLGPVLDALTTDASDASGTGYFNSATGEYESELLEAALGGRPILPRIIAAGESAGKTPEGILVAGGAGDNAGAALGLQMIPGDVVVSIGTSGTVFAVTDEVINDSNGVVAGFSDATGNYLPIAVTLNAARVLANTAELLGVDFDEFAKLALSAVPGSDGLTLVPYYEGERTPNLPNAKASLHGMTLSSTTRPNLARASIEGMLCGLADGLDALVALGVQVNRVLLIGGGAQSAAVQEVARTIFNYSIEVPAISEYVAEGAAIQAAWTLSGNRPDWKIKTTKLAPAEVVPEIRINYAAACAK